MSKRLLLVAAATLVATGIAYAQFPIMNMVADRVVQRYQSSSCEQLWQNRGKHGPEEQRLVGMLKSDPQMREQFINKIAGPVVNKMFECGMVP